MTPTVWRFVVGIAAVGVIALAAIYTFRSKVAEVWQGEAAAEKARGDRLELRVEEQSVQIIALKARVDTLEATNKDLATLATGRPDFQKLVDQVAALTLAITTLNAVRAEQHAQNEMHLERLEAGISRIETQVINGGPSVPRQRRTPPAN